MPPPWKPPPPPWKPPPPCCASTGAAESASEPKPTTPARAVPRTSFFSPSESLSIFDLLRSPRPSLARTSNFDLRWERMQTPHSFRQSFRERTSLASKCLENANKKQRPAPPARVTADLVRVVREIVRSHLTALHVVNGRTMGFAAERQAP